ncbi:hypothetical protein V8C44DRAFT_364778 [Trichoderma aethiopicum]
MPSLTLPTSASTETLLLKCQKETHKPPLPPTWTTHPPNQEIHPPPNTLALAIRIDAAAPTSIRFYESATNRPVGAVGPEFRGSLVLVPWRPGLKFVIAPSCRRKDGCLVGIIREGKAGSPRGASPAETPRVISRGSHEGAPRVVPGGTPVETPQIVPRGASGETTRVAPRETSTETPEVVPKGTPVETLQVMASRGTSEETPQVVPRETSEETLQVIPKGPPAETPRIVPWEATPEETLQVVPRKTSAETPQAIPATSTGIPQTTPKTSPKLPNPLPSSIPKITANMKIKAIPKPNPNTSPQPNPNTSPQPNPAPTPKSHAKRKSHIPIAVPKKPTDNANAQNGEQARPSRHGTAIPSPVSSCGGGGSRKRKHVSFDDAVVVGKRSSRMAMAVMGR